jgi:hypothetical protein
MLRHLQLIDAEQRAREPLERRYSSDAVSSECSDFFGFLIRR